MSYARSLLRRSLSALGVAATDPAAAAVRGFEIVMEARQARGNWAQARRWTDSSPFPVPTTLRYVVDLARRRALYELKSPAPGDIWFNYLTRYDTVGAWQVDLLRWRLGTDIVRAGAAPSATALGNAERLLPHVIVQQALASPGLRYAGTRASAGRRLEVVSFTDATSRQAFALELDAESMLPATLVTSGPNATSVEYADYRTERGVRVPFRRVQRAGDILASEQRVVRIDLRPSLDDGRFAIPPGYLETPTAGPPRATRVAGAVYRLDGMPGGYHAAFIVGDSGVTVLEAPQSSAYSDVALRIIDATAPGRGITHVFVTHHHSDHVGGLAPYVARGAIIVVGAGLEDAVRRQLPDSLRARARFESVDERRSFGAGAVRVDAYAVPNEHADGNIAYHVPDARVLFQGDLFYIPDRGDVPPAFTVTDALVRALGAHGIRPEHVVGVHGRTGAWPDVGLSLQRAGRPMR